MNSPIQRSPLISVDQNLTAEVKALRDRIQVQHGLVELLLERLRSQNGEQSLETLDISEPLPLHPLRAEDSSDEANSTASGEGREVERDAGESVLVRGTTWWPIQEKAFQPLLPNPGWEFHGIGSSISVIGFSLEGMGAKEVEKAIDLVREAQRHKATFIPVFLTDHPDLAVFRRHGYVAEYLPQPLNNDDQLPLRFDRRRLIERKWNISRVFEFEQVMHDAALESGSLLDGGPRLEFQSTRKAAAGRAKNTVAQPLQIKKLPPKKRRTRKKREANDE